MGNGGKLIVSMLVLIAFVGGATYLALNTVNVLGYEIRSVKDYGAGIEELEKAETTYTEAVQKENKAKNDLKSKITVFESQKESYNNISDDTIKLIKDATKIEKYSIEYLWVRIGNYATKYNLTVVLTEAGETVSANAADGTTGDNGNSGTSEDVPGSEPLPGENTTAEFPGLDTTLPTDETTETDTSNSAGVLKISVKGAYKSICDFIYAVENDNTLRFKLENIAIKGGESVTANFEVKNMQIVK